MLSDSVIKFPACVRSGPCCERGRGMAEGGTLQRPRAAK